MEQTNNSFSNTVNKINKILYNRWTLLGLGFLLFVVTVVYLSIKSTKVSLDTRKKAANQILMICKLIYGLFALIIIFYLCYNLFVWIWAITHNRVSNCELVYQDNGYSANFGNFPTTYDNPYYQKTMPLKVSDFYWASSRKSYLPCGETYDKVSLTNLGKIIEKGARVLELDVWGDESYPYDPDVELVVRNDTIFPEEKPLLLRDCLAVIKRDAWTRNTNYPLILILNTNIGNNPVAYKKMKELLLAMFEDRLLDKKYGYAGRYNTFPLGSVPIAEMMGKIAIVTNKYPLNTEVDEIINGFINSDSDYIQLVEYGMKNVEYGGMIATFTDTNSLIQHNKEYLMKVEPASEKSVANFYSPKSGINNIPSKDPHKFGVQWVMMNYSKYDANMQEYVEFFRNSSLVLKPDELRYIPKPLPPINKQNKLLSYGPRKLMVPGWYNQQI